MTILWWLYGEPIVIVCFSTQRVEGSVMTKTFFLIVSMLLAMTTILLGADAAGKWVAETPGRGGGAPRQITFAFQFDGSQLTGTYRIGEGTPPTVISDGKVDGNNISFTVKREMNGNTMVTKFEATVNGDEMKVRATRDGQDGTPVTSQLTLKRSTTK